MNDRNSNTKSIKNKPVVFMPPVYFFAKDCRGYGNPA